ncbi:hypothetical protein HZA56_02905 [Candidatus Poribacteria bacterium]|nr:hypothetical protein [Candidatus Poribacteria bacterium]
MTLKSKMNNFDFSWATAHAKLLRNIHQQGYVPKTGAVSVTLGGHKVFLPAYVPYIGEDCFSYRPRVLCYAINQNLSDHAPWTQELLHRWGTNLAKTHPLDFLLSAGIRFLHNS